MNVRNSIVNRVSEAAEALKELKKNKVITDDSVEVEWLIPDPVDWTNDCATAKFKVSYDLSV